MDQPVIASIVEGHGEVAALPVLLRRVLSSYGRHDVLVHQPHRVPRGQMLTDEVTRAASLQGSRITAGGGVLVLLDADDDDVGSVREDVLRRAAAGAGGRQVVVVVAVREFEAWFLAGVESLRDHVSVSSDATFPGDPDGPRDAKGRLRGLMLEAYKPVIHQPAFCQLLDVAAAEQRSASFRLFIKSVRELTRD